MKNVIHADIHYENTTKIKPIGEGEIKLSNVICHQNDEIWLTYNYMYIHVREVHGHLLLHTGKDSVQS